MIVAAIEMAFTEGSSKVDLKECRHMIAHIVGLLLIYMTPGEAYCVVVELIRST